MCRIPKRSELHNGISDTGGLFFWSQHCNPWLLEVVCQQAKGCKMNTVATMHTKVFYIPSIYIASGAWTHFDIHLLSSVGCQSKDFRLKKYVVAVLDLDCNVCVYP